MPTTINYKTSHIQGKNLFRNLPVTSVRAIEDDNRKVDISFSSEGDCERYFGVEVLGHGNGEARLDWLASGNAPLLIDHDWTKQVGIIESASIGSDRKGRALVRFGKSALANEIYQDVKDSIRRNISVGYFVNRMVLEDTGSDDSPDRYRVVDWEPFELSFVSVPADKDVGVGRAINTRPIEILTPITLNHKSQESTMEEDDKKVPEKQNSRETDRVAILTDVRKAEKDRTKAIRSIAKAHNMADFGERAIENGTEVQLFQSELLEELSRAEPQKLRTVKEDDGLIGLSDKEVKSYSLLRAISAVANNAPETAPFEMEVAKATREKFRHRSFSGKIQVPMDIMIAKRDLTAGGATAGAELVGTNHLGESFIDALRGRLLINQLGARFMTGLVGNVTIPKLAQGATAYWVNETESVTESTQITGNVTLSPKTVGAWTDISRRLLLQSSPDAESLVRDDLMKVVARAIDSAAYSGTGSGGEPAGIINTTGIGSVDYGDTLTFDDLVDMETEIAIDNADMGSMHYVTTPLIRGTLKKTLKDPGVPDYIYQKGEVNGYPAHATSLMVPNEIIFANWEDLIVANWGVLDLKVDESALVTSGGVRVVVLQDVDIAVRHPESFCRAFT